ncbi:MAG: hypothetical protein SGJ20_08780 [Planctomycetota bacterium]|nr:hypothetical protein [Planctomycetota bacterium]
MRRTFNLTLTLCLACCWSVVLQGQTTQPRGAAPATGSAQVGRPEVRPATPLPALRGIGPVVPAQVTPAAGDTASPVSGTPDTGIAAPVVPPNGNTVGPASKPAAKAGPTAPSGSVQQIQPEVTYRLYDKDGVLVPVPGMTLEEFTELYQLKKQLKQPRQAPGASIQQLTVTGEVSGSNVDLQVQVQLRLSEAGWTRIPLGLGSAALQPGAEYKGEGEHVLQFDKASGEYVVLIRGEKQSEHQLNLKLVAPLVAVSNATRLVLQLPSAVSSKLTLDVPGTATEISSSGKTVPDLTKIAGDRSRISTLGVSGPFHLQWSTSDKLTARLPTLLEANGLCLLKIDGRSVTSEMTLTVRSFGAEFDSFRVKLPKGAVSTGGKQPGVTISPIANTTPPEVKVTLDQPTTGPVDVKLVTERAYDVTKEDEILELAGFEVEGAELYRQGGQIALVVVGDWQVLWDKRARVRQIDEPAEALKRKDLLAAFEYVGQPFTLNARIVPRKTRVIVDPEYVFLVDATETRLQARLKYAVRGAKVFDFELEMPGWTIEEIGPANVVDSPMLVAGDESRIQLPLIQPTVGDVEITLTARRAHPANASQLELAMPYLLADTVNPATVAIVPADNIELTTRVEELVDMSAQRPVTSIALPERQQAPLFFRAERSQSKYVGSVAEYRQKVSVQVGSAIQVRSRDLLIEQKLNYEVLYEPLDRITLIVPRNLDRPTQTIEASLDGQKLTPLVIAEDDSTNTLRMQLVLSKPRIGALQLDLQYVLPLESLQPAAMQVVDLPLCMPLEGRLTANTATLTVEPGLNVLVRGDAWTKRVKSDAPTSNQLQLLTSARETTLPLSVSIQEQKVYGKTVVECGWVQTELLGDVRQERAVFQVDTREPQVQLRLPEQVSTADFEILLDQVRQFPDIDEDRQVTIQLANSATTGPQHTIELRYQYLNHESDTGLVTLNAPTFTGDVWMRKMYWQLIVPRDEHLIWSANSLTPEYRWNWKGVGFGRTDLKDQPQLEALVGAVKRNPIPEATNPYLFSSFGSKGTYEVRIARRGTVVFLPSLILLVATLVLIYVPVVQRPITALIAILLLGAASIAFPEPALLVLQASIIGVVLSLLAVLLYRFLRRPARPGVAPVSTVSRSSILSHRSTEALNRAGTAESHGSHSITSLTGSGVSSNSAATGSAAGGRASVPGTTGTNAHLAIPPGAATTSNGGPAGNELRSDPPGNRSAGSSISRKESGTGNASNGGRTGSTATAALPRPPDSSDSRIQQ